LFGQLRIVQSKTENIFEEQYENKKYIFEGGYTNYELQIYNL